MVWFSKCFVALNQRALIIGSKLLELGATPVEVAEVLERVGEEVDEERVYTVLKQVDPELAEMFRREMNLFVWRTDLRKEPFRRSRIVKSLVKETGIPKSLAEKIAKEVERKIRESNLTFITSSLVRELALIKLIEYGKEDAYRKYARLGIPLYDLSVMVKRGGSLRDKVAGRIFVQYAVLYLFPRPLVDGLFEGYVEVGGVFNPFVPYANTYYTKVTDVERWWSGLLNYLVERPFVEGPSIYVPPFLEEEDLKFLERIKKATGAILWSTDDVPGTVKSEVPVFSFGRVPDRRVLDLITVDIEKVFLLNKDPWSVLNSLSEAIEEYGKRKRSLVKGGSIYVKFLNVERADRDRLMDVFSSFRVL